MLDETVVLVDLILRQIAEAASLKTRFVTFIHFLDPKCLQRLLSLSASSWHDYVLECKTMDATPTGGGKTGYFYGYACISLRRRMPVEKRKTPRNPARWLYYRWKRKWWVNSSILPTIESCIHIATFLIGIDEVDKVLGSRAILRISDTGMHHMNFKLYGFIILFVSSN